MPARSANDGEDETVSSVTSSGSVGSIDALLSVQEMSATRSAAARPRRAPRSFWEQLDALRHGLLAGHLSPERLDQLVALVSSQRAETSDPALGETLDAIELLAKVELAKLGRDV